MNRDNLDYLVSTLSRRTKGKKYENFVVNWLWHALGDETLKPVTQQYVNRRAVAGSVGLVNYAYVSAEDSHHALIDLYFPQLRLGVECDERKQFSEDGQRADAERRADIRRVIPDYEELRVAVQVGKDGFTVHPDHVVQRLEEFRTRIVERKQKVEAGSYPWASGLQPWRTNLADWQVALEYGVLRASDALLFKHNGQIRELFGQGDGAGTNTSNFETKIFLPSDYVVWCPTLSERVNDQYRSTDSKGILNILIPEGDEVYIGQADPTPDHDRDEAVRRNKERREHNKEREAQEPLEAVPPYTYTLTPDDYGPSPGRWATNRRVTFPRARDTLNREGYQFMGVFKPVTGASRFRQVNGVWFSLVRLVDAEIDLGLFATV